MAAMGNIEIIFDIEPVCKVVCVAVTCRHNLMQLNHSVHCNLKHIDLDDTGRCNSFKAQDGDEEKS
jgi:hypothetical protein